MTYESSGEYLAKKQAPLPGYESSGEYLTENAAGGPPHIPPGISATIAGDSDAWRRGGQRRLMPE